MCETKFLVSMTSQRFVKRLVTNQGVTEKYVLHCIAICQKIRVLMQGKSFVGSNYSGIKTYTDEFIVFKTINIIKKVTMRLGNVGKKPLKRVKFQP